MVWASRIIRLNVLIGMTSLGIQTQILIPWHDIISEDLKKVERRLEQVETLLREDAKKA